MKKASKQSGISVVEALLSVALFALFFTAFMGAFIFGEESTRTAGERVRAVLLAEEGIEASRNIRDSGWSNLTTGTHGLDGSGSSYSFSGSSDTIDIFTRTIQVSDLDDSSCGGLPVAGECKEVVATVTWTQSETRGQESVVLTTRFTNWLDEN